ncbi:WD40 repeat domain-containing protein, partial [Streptomyces cellostaticus]|uniref:WD40 repeat domain-containing protein n=1 Tax=Streptomyces cellostaticus TaxID=67285 RepID=UPI00202765E7
KGDPALSQSEQDALPDSVIQQGHDSIARALAPLVGGDARQQPHPYIARHLAEHAALAGVLDDDHLPPPLLPWVAGAAVRRLLHLPHRGGDNRWWLRAWAAIEPYIAHADLPSRCSSLHLAHTTMRFPGLPASAVPRTAHTFDGSQLRVLWSRWAPPDNVLATLNQSCLALAASHRGEGELIALGAETGTIDLLDASTGGVVGDRIRAHDGAVRCLTWIWDDDHKTLVSGSTDGSVCIWDAGSRLLNHRLIQTTWIAALACCRTPAGELTVFCITGQGDLTYWKDDGEGMRPLALLRPHPAEPSAFAALVTCTADGQDVLVCAGGTLTIRNAATNHHLAEHPLHAGVRTLTGTSVPGQIAAGHHDGSVTVWTLPAAADKHLPASEEPIIALAGLDCDGVQLMAVGRGNTIDLWNLGTCTRAGSLTGHADTVVALHSVHGPQPTILISCSNDNTMRHWTAEAVRNALKGATPAPAALAAASMAAPGTELRLAIAYPALLQIWRPRTGTSEATLTLPAAEAATALTWHPDTDTPQLLWSASDCTVRVWQPLAADTDPIVFAGHQQTIRRMATCTHNGACLLISSDDYTVRLWDMTTRQPLHIWQHPYRISSITATTGRDDALWIATGSADDHVRMWHPAHNEPHRAFPCHQGVINAVAIDADNPHGPHLATAGDATLRLWSLDDHTPIGPHLCGHTDVINAVAAWTSPRPRPRAYLASASRDGTVRIWDATSGRCVLQLAVGNHVHTLTAHPHPHEPVTTLTLTGEAGVVAVELRMDGW